MSIDICCLLLFRVGGKDKPTRFLSFVEAVHGFRHLLTQEDLDRAMSLCTSLKGHLKSRFLVLSDDRILPPYQPNRGKRSRPDDAQEAASVKRTHQDPAPQHPIAGVSAIQVHPVISNASVVPVVQAPAPLPNYSALMSAVSNPLIQGSSVVQVYPANTSIQSGQMIPGPTVMQPLTFMSMSVPPPQIVPPTPVVSGPAVPEVTAQSPGFKVARSRQRGRTSAAAKAAGSSGRTTPSRAAKAPKEKTAQSIQPTVTSPDEPYESCASNEEDGDNLMDEAQA